MKSNPCTSDKCHWHRNNKDGSYYSEDAMFPQGICPFLWHSIYPYLLGRLFGAKGSYDQDGTFQVCCPAMKGVDVLVKKTANDGHMDAEWVPSDWRDTIYAEVVKVGSCPHGHTVGKRFIFPTCAYRANDSRWRNFFACPAGVYNSFPFLNLTVPSCIDKNKIRCPDWLEDVTYATE
jgi:uncharacterized repeat protein (TIGR04076 family)